MMKKIVNIILFGLVGVVYAGAETYKEIQSLNMCIEYSGCLTKDDFSKVKKFLFALTHEDRNNHEVFKNILGLIW